MNLGQISALLAWGATAAYAIALVAFATDLARLADTRVARRRSAVAVPVGAGAGAVDVVDRDEGAAPAGDAPAGDAPEGAPRAVRIGRSVVVAGLLLHALAIVTRGIAAGRVPWANMYEFTLVGTFAAVVAFLVLARARPGMIHLGTFVAGVCTMALGLGLRAFYVPAVPVEPILQSPWLVIHVSIATVATGLFTVALAASVLQLIKDSREARRPVPAAVAAADGRGEPGDAVAGSGLAGRRWRFLDVLPPVRELEAVAFRVNAVAFVLWTFTIVSGALWAEVAWGRYWNWDPKEVWSFVVWVIYAAYLHARTTRGWAGRRAAWFVVVGYAALIFNYTVVNLLIPGNHSYSGI